MVLFVSGRVLLWCRMTGRLDREFVNIPMQSCDASVVWAVYLSTSSALMMVRISSAPAAYIYKLWYAWECEPLMSDPSV